MKLTDAVPADPDTLYEHFHAWAAQQGITPYPHQDEAALEIFTGNHLVLATPTGSGKSLVALAAHFAALASDKVSFYTAPIKALVSEKFFSLCEVFGADNVGMITGDASVNADAPIICCTAEILAQIGLAEGEEADIGQVVADEFHFYSEPDRGWAWQVPLLTLPQAQFVLMSATLGDTEWLQEDLKRRTGREVAVVDNAERPVPLVFSWSVDPLHDKIAELVSTQQAPVYVVHFTQADAARQAQSMTSLKLLNAEERERIGAEIGAFRFGPGFGKILSKLVRHGIGVHHAGMLPKYRRLVEQLAQTGLLKVICGTDTLGVGINVPIRTVLFTGLTKFDGAKQRRLKSREFHQIAGRAGRAGFDTVGYVVCQAPEHEIENAKLLAKAGDDPKKLKKVQRKKAPEGFVSWSEETFEKLQATEPEQLQSRMRVNESMILNVVEGPGDPWVRMKALMQDNHSDAKTQRRLSRRAISITRGLLDAGVLVKIPDAGPGERGCRMTDAVQDDFALNQPLAPFAVEVIRALDREDPEYHLHVISVIEAVLDNPMPVLIAQKKKAKGEAIGEMKADGMDYFERMEAADEIEWPQPLAEHLEYAMLAYVKTHPWVDADALAPKAVVRDMWEQALDFTSFISQYQLARSEGVVLRYLTDCYRTLRQTVPESARTEELEDVIEWLGETVRQTDSSLLDEWEALTDPEAVARAAEAAAAGKPPAPPRPITGNTRVFTAMVRNLMWRKVELVAEDRWGDLADIEAEMCERADVDVVMGELDWDAACGDYFDEHTEVLLDADARGPGLLAIDRGPDRWEVRQIIHDPEGNHDWQIHAEVLIEASEAEGTAVVRVLSFGRMG
ncbi:DEAD/DEAH box helicase [Propioniferax innocua]|uniref:Helicase-like protein n=1 Tax=Propioniferax innocua TaxID=1753 RepID=A0A542ZRY8_9ACTN|nr:DEAD/DEAH box helicase [Propioniferax innocua]TQL63128.1 helicase-like protein [Propioniferax innocua]